MSFDLEQISEEFVELKARVTDLETKHDSLLSKLDVDTGVNDTNYASLKGTIANDPKTVTNITASIPGRPKGFLVKVKDMFGTEFVVKPGTPQVVHGKSANMTAWETKGYITVT